MPKKKVVNNKKLIAAVESGRPSKEIMEKFGINTSSQLKATYLDALVQEGMAPGIISSRGRAGKSEDNKKTKEIKVNKRGSLVIPKEMVEEFGFSLGEAFSVTKNKAGISVKRV